MDLRQFYPWLLCLWLDSPVVSFHICHKDSLPNILRHYRPPRSSFSFTSMMAVPSLNQQHQNHDGIVDTIEELEENSVYWCPEQQIYVGGVPSNAAVDQMIRDNDGYLRIFGYGSLCWNPGTGILADAAVTKTSGRVKGYRRCWAQKSTDHRGTTSFPGIVCTLLTDDEFRRFRSAEAPDETESMTEGSIYLVPPSLVQVCLSELDIREQGGYARDIITAVQDETEETVQCLLYRGTPDSPAFWPRALKSLTFAAAVISAAVGPSGSNEVYLSRLGQFLDDKTLSTKSLASSDDTFALARIVEQIRKDYSTFFFNGCGSNQHNQLLLKDVPDLIRGEDAQQMTESVLIYPSLAEPDPIVKLCAGTGHSGAITASGRLFLFGWNDHSQLGTCRTVETDGGLFVVTELEGIRVLAASLGFSHSLVIAEDGRLYAFGDNSRGQVTGKAGSGDHEPRTPSCLATDKVVSAATGLYHSAAVTESGQLVVFGCSRFGQSLSVSAVSSGVRWKPADGALVVKVACGRYHSMALDNLGRLWSFGDNRYCQLGRPTNERKTNLHPGLVIVPPSMTVSDMSCGWSHTMALASDSEGTRAAFGWGRGDKGQLGTERSVESPMRRFQCVRPQQVICGTESTYVVDDLESVWSSGWNEHGNLATGDAVDRFELSRIPSAPNTTPGYGDTRLLLAAGGAHLLVGRLLVNDKDNN